MQSIDVLYQESVDKEAYKLFKLSATDLIKMDDYGTIEIFIKKRRMSIAWWHYKFDENLHHFVFLNTRRILVLFKKKYLSGVKLENGKVQMLTDIELGQYD